MIARGMMSRVVCSCVWLASGPALLQVWEEIDFVDIPGRLIPEWLAIRNRRVLRLRIGIRLTVIRLRWLRGLVVNTSGTVMMIGIIRRCCWLDFA